MGDQDKAEEMGWVLISGVKQPLPGGSKPLQKQAELLDRGTAVGKQR